MPRAVIVKPSAKSVNTTTVQCNDMAVARGSYYIERLCFPLRSVKARHRVVTYLIRPSPQRSAGVSSKSLDLYTKTFRSIIPELSLPRLRYVINTSTVPSPPPSIT